MQHAQIDRLRSAAIPVQQLFVCGLPEPALSEQRLYVVSPIDGEVLTTIVDGNAADIDRAVKQARLVF
ncbi:hypothetical protein ABTB92_20470, partial [Acinetobacter baumannii]